MSQMLEAIRWFLEFKAWVWISSRLKFFGLEFQATEIFENLIRLKKSCAGFRIEMRFFMIYKCRVYKLCNNEILYLKLFAYQKSWFRRNDRLLEMIIYAHQKMLLVCRIAKAEISGQRLTSWVTNLSIATFRDSLIPRALYLEWKNNSVFTHHLNSYLQYFPTLINMTKCFGRDETLPRVHKETNENSNIQINGSSDPSFGFKAGP